MKHRNSHFRYTRDQRNGIFYLILLIIICQLGFYFWSNRTEKDFPVVNAELMAEFEAERDSLLKLQKRKDSLKQFKYNPNYLTDFRAYQWGMSVEEIDRLFAFRESGKFINSEKEFQNITGISDSLFHQIRPLLKFRKFAVESKATKKVKNEPVIRKDINTATAEELMKVKGVGEVLSKRIVKYRDLLQGFTFEDQLYEVYHLKQEVAEKVWHYFEIQSRPEIEQINVNTATFKELISISYIDYELAKKILEYRDEVAEILEVKELEKIDGFPVDKLDRIVLYLSAN